MAFPHAAGYGTDSPVWHHRQQQSGSEQDRSREQQGDEPAKQAKQRNGETASPAKTNGNGQPQSQGSVVAQLSDIVQTRSLLYRSNKVDWQVIEFYNDEERTVLEHKRTHEQLGLQPRDIGIFVQTRAGVQAQRATIAPREGMLLFRSEIAKAIIWKDKACLFHAKRFKDTLHVAQAINASLATDLGLPFEFRILEALLAETAHHFEAQSRRLTFVAESVVHEVNGSLRGHVGELQRLLPIQRALTEIQHDVKETREAIAEIADNDKNLGMICLSEQGSMARAGDNESLLPFSQGGAGPASLSAGNGRACVAAETAGYACGLQPVIIAVKARPKILPPQNERYTNNMILAVTLLEAYERQIQSVEGALRELSENLDSTREVWGMQLDAIRNRIVRMDLIVAIASFSILMSTVPASYFGMNLHSGWEDDPNLLWLVAACCTVASTLTFLGVYGYWRFWPNRRHQRRVRDMTALRDLLVHHADDLDEILAKLRNKSDIGRKSFVKLVREAVKDRIVPDDEVELLYRVFDTNRDGFLSMGEVLRAQSTLRFGGDHFDYYNERHD
eukprot:jgi/Astpho2/8499/fgenesh1_pg.00125_%23_12_t